MKDYGPAQWWLNVLWGEGPLPAACWGVSPALQHCVHGPGVWLLHIKLLL